MTEPTGPETIRAAVQELRRRVEAVNHQGKVVAQLRCRVKYVEIEDLSITPPGRVDHLTVTAEYVVTDERVQTY